MKKKKIWGWDADADSDMQDMKAKKARQQQAARRLKQDWYWKIHPFSWIKPLLLQVLLVGERQK